MNTKYIYISMIHKQLKTYFKLKYVSIFIDIINHMGSVLG